MKFVLVHLSACGTVLWPPMSSWSVSLLSFLSGFCQLCTHKVTVAVIIVSFPIVLLKSSGQKHLKEEGLVWAHSSKSHHRWGVRCVKRPVTFHPPSGRRVGWWVRGCSCLLSSRSLFSHSWMLGKEWCHHWRGSSHNNTGITHRHPRGPPPTGF